MSRRFAMLAVPMLVAASVVATTAQADAAGAIQFRRFQYDSPGSDTGSNTSLNAEYFQLKNVTTRTFNLYGWTVRDAAGHTYRFSSSFYLRPGYTVTVHTGRGTNTSYHRYWGSSWYIWNNTGDKAYLRTPSGTLVDYCAWTSIGAGYKYC
ncbi:MAG TPA: lamin tail domain-containing protein [Kribbellaceae bacterium]|nr:lamin tail domain-containing protein [Kribbellaceae bacterium]